MVQKYQPYFICTIPNYRLKGCEDLQYEKIILSSTQDAQFFAITQSIERYDSDGKRLLLILLKDQEQLESFYAYLMGRNN